MSPRSDPRIPLTVFRAPDDLPAWLASGPPAAMLADTEAAPPGAAAVAQFTARAPHRFACACCAGRSPAALALDRLFQARARGTGAWFERIAVLATSRPGHEQVVAALRQDVLTCARFRLA